MNCKYALGKTEIRFLFTSSRRGEWLASTFSISTSSAHSWFNLQPLRSQAYLCPPLSWCWRFLPVPALWKLLQTASRSHYLALLKKKKKPYTGCFYDFKSSYNCAFEALMCFDLHYLMQTPWFELFSALFSLFTLVLWLFHGDKTLHITTLELSVPKVTESVSPPSQHMHD